MRRPKFFLLLQDAHPSKSAADKDTNQLDDPLNSESIEEQISRADKSSVG